MAVVEPIQKKIKAHQYVYDSIAYVLSPENKHGDEKCFQATCLNCDGNNVDSITKHFYLTRYAFNKDKEILAHHYVQSFSPNEKITPELAHQIGVELAEKVAPGFQVVVSTHIDKNHIHNHIIINSVSMETGMKWKGNKTTLTEVLQKESDKICKLYGLTTIKNKSGLKGVDQTTQKLAEQGKSWKVELCKALDEAVKMCNTKQEFIDFMKRKNFDITRYGEKDITFQKIGEKKKIRASRLATQFGDYYTKENLEKLMGFYRLPKKSEQPPDIKNSKPQKSSFISEFEKYEKNHFSKNPPPAKISETKFLQQIIRNSNRPLLILLLIIMRLLIRQNKKSRLNKKYSILHRYCSQQKYKIYKPSLKEQIAKTEKMQMTAGNIPYRNLVAAQGENYRIKIALSSVPKLYAYPFFFSARLYKDYALVTIKEKDKLLLQKALAVENIQVLENHNKHYSSKADYIALKNRAEQLGVKIEFLNITAEQFEKLKDEKDRFVSSLADGKIRLAFLPQNKDYILHTLYPDKYKTNDLFSVARNSKVNTKLKSEALLGGQKMRYRTLTKKQVEKLYAESDTKELFAVFNKNAKGQSLGDNYNIAFKESDIEKIENALNNQEKTKRKNFP
ncbi:MAG: relaxase/mobilization nuclease domain-containing protein [Clostridia bacterium]|nr:relaxase/mobilization nuclease domain-containing protein [Clostridia bacterium]